jgi:hypothetical protein
MRREATVVMALAIMGVLFVILVHPYVDGPHSTAVQHRTNLPAIMMSFISWNPIVSSISAIPTIYSHNYETPNRLALNCAFLC